jgi:hypothetical protein
MVSPHVAALRALWKLEALEPGVRIQFEPVVRVGQLEVPCAGIVKLTVATGNVGRVGDCACTFTMKTKRKTKMALANTLIADRFLLTLSARCHTEYPGYEADTIGGQCLHISAATPLMSE